MDNTCPICGEQLLSHLRAADTESFDCPNCGKYTLTGTLVATPGTVLADNDSSALLSQAIRKMQRKSSPLPGNKF